MRQSTRNACLACLVSLSIPAVTAAERDPAEDKAVDATPWSSAWGLIRKQSSNPHPLTSLSDEVFSCVSLRP
jgi:hypothetical protein